jgi:hypothetical protein
MGCCRGRKRIDPRRQPTQCKTLEDGGARMMVQVIATDQGLRLVVSTARHGYLDLGSFLSAFGCNGSTARLLRRYLPVIQRAQALDPKAFSAYRSGISITELIRVAERAAKGMPDARTHKVPPNLPHQEVF